MSRRVFAEALSPGAWALSAEESHYVRDVLRLAPGDALTLFDGAGAEASARVSRVDRQGVWVTAEEPRAAAVLPPAVVVLGLPRPALVDEAVTLGTEAGATAFWLVNGARTQVASPRLDRLERVARAAARQCRRGAAPTLRALPSLEAAVAGAASLGLPCLLGDLDAADGVPPCPSGVVVAIGPEGGWSDAERATLRDGGFVGVRLGQHVLRAPTAVAVALGLALTRW